MTDKVSKEKRSEIMSHIRGKDTSIEVAVRLWMFHHGIRYRKNVRDIEGTPDIAIKKYKIAIFVNGCFWHGHDNCKYFKLPKSNTEFWKTKIEKNMERDIQTHQNLTNSGWLVLVLWECELKKNFEVVMMECLSSIKSRMIH